MAKKTTIPAAPEAQALALAVFRICYGIVLFLEVCHLYYFRHFVLDPVPYLQPAPTLLSILLVVWLGTILCIIFGVKTTLACVLNYGFTLFFLNKLVYPLFEYHVDYVYTGINFLLLIIPVSDRLSVDAYWRFKKQIRFQPVRNYAVFINTILFVGVALVYADSVFFKGGSPIWCGGLGVWLPASLPQDSWFPVPQFLLDQKWLMLTMGYLTLVFETLFPFLMWWKRARLVLFVIGTGLHFSIGLVFPIPFFGLAYVAIYLLLLPDSFWQILDRRLQRFFQQDNTATKSGVQATIPDRFSLGTREKLTLAVLCLAITLQSCLIIGRFPNLPEQIKPAFLKPIASLVTNSCATLRNKIKRPAHEFLGLTDHPVFMDSHFRNYTRIYAIVYTKPEGDQRFLPVSGHSGRPGAYLTGRFWVWWNWRVGGPEMTKKGFLKGVQKATAFWAFKNNVSLEHADFDILSRPVQTPTEWVPGHLANQKQQKWKVVAHATWRDRKIALSTKK